MPIKPVCKLFGSRRRTEVLLLLSLLDESYATQLAALLRVPTKTVQRILEGLEDEQVLVARTEGRERWFSFNRRHPGNTMLRSLLDVLATLDSDILQAAASLRRRPRARQKAI